MIPIYSVTELNRQVKNWLEQDIGELCVQGEISNLTKPSSGHWYFTLKDSQAQLRCVFFRNRHRLHHRGMEAGHLVLAQGKLSLYEARGDYQLIIEELSEAGLGDLHQQFELLKVQLAAKGLFDAGRKKPLPRYPQIIGVITSPTGAALHDILTTLERRYPQALVRVYPSDVQGKLAAGLLCAAIKQANRDNACDVLILARGGGSLEDLWAFNNEQLAYAIADSMIPIVTGIGHETDITIADFVADLRAPTPTAAAEVVSPLQDDMLLALISLETQLIAAMQRRLQNHRLLLTHQMTKLTSPKQMIGRYWQSLDYLERQLQQGFTQMRTRHAHQIQLLLLRLRAQHPAIRLAQTREAFERNVIRLTQVIHLLCEGKRQRLQAVLARLHTVSPLATLDRGYALVTQDQHLVTKAKDVSLGEVIEVRLAKGRLRCEVLEKHP